MSSDKDKNPWARAAPSSGGREWSPHAPLELPPGIAKAVKKAAAPPPGKIWSGTGVTPPPPDWTLDDRFQELVQNGVPRDQAARHLRYDFLGWNFKAEPELDRARPFEVKGDRLVVWTTDGRRLDAADIRCCEVIDSSWRRHPSAVEREEAKLLAEARKREMLDALRPSRPGHVEEPPRATEPKAAVARNHPILATDAARRKWILDALAEHGRSLGERGLPKWLAQKYGDEIGEPAFIEFNLLRHRFDGDLKALRLERLPREGRPRRR